MLSRYPTDEKPRELKAEGLSQRQTSEVLGVDQKTVSNDLRTEENSSKNGTFLSETEENSSNVEPVKPQTFNQVNDNIGWAKWSWNPVTGCLHNCDYCYARDIEGGPPAPAWTFKS